MLLAIDIGNTKTDILVASTPEKISQPSVFPTPHDKTKFLPALHAHLNSVIKPDQVEAVGVACRGPIDRTKGTWQGLPIEAELKKHFNCPVVFEHDANSGGIAEAQLGSGQSYNVVLYVTISTGIGSAIIINGQPLPTTNNSEGGRQVIQNTPFPGKQLEQLVSGQAIVHRFGKIAAEIDDVKTWQLISQDLAIGIYNLITIVQPDVVVLAGGVCTHYEKFGKFLQADLEKLPNQYPLPPIKLARYVETAPAIGALILAQQAV